MEYNINRRNKSLWVLKLSGVENTQVDPIYYMTFVRLKLKAPPIT